LGSQPTLAGGHVSAADEPLPHGPGDAG